MINFYNLVIDNNKIPQLNITKKSNYNGNNISLEEIVNILNDVENTDILFKEHAYVVSLNVNMDVLGVYVVSIGNTKSCMFYKKEIMTFLLLTGADQFVLCHNHPSDILEPSSSDIESYYDMENTTKPFSINLIDSIIICKSGWYCIKSEVGDSYEENDF